MKKEAPSPIPWFAQKNRNEDVDATIMAMLICLKNAIIKRNETGGEIHHSEVYAAMTLAGAISVKYGVPDGYHNTKKGSDLDGAQSPIARLPEVMRITGFGKTLVHKLSDDPKSGFPPKIQLTERLIGWNRRDVLAWLADRGSAEPLDGSN